VPSAATVRSWSGWMRITARFRLGVGDPRPARDTRACRETTTISSAPLITWKFVSRRPRLSKITPEPSPRWRNSPPPLGPSGPKNCLKKSWRKGSSGAGCAPEARGRRAFWIVSRLTTAGRTCSATPTKPAWRPSASSRPPGRRTAGSRRLDPRVFQGSSIAAAARAMSLVGPGHPLVERREPAVRLPGGREAWRYGLQAGFVGVSRARPAPPWSISYRSRRPARPRASGAAAGSRRSFPPDFFRQFFGPDGPSGGGEFRQRDWARAVILRQARSPAHELPRDQGPMRSWFVSRTSASYRGQVVGTDPKTDLAVIRIQPTMT